LLWFDVLGMLGLAVGLTGLAKTLQIDVTEAGQQDASDPRSVHGSPNSPCAAVSNAETREAADARS
jgi:hypothetical protein